MSKRIRADRVAVALSNIADWRNQAKSQAATHLLPLLALIERGAGNPPGTVTLMNETPHEFQFWDRYFRLDDGNVAKPYFNPMTRRRAEAGFPHGNSATIRKNTFDNKWNAASRTPGDGGEYWTLAENYAEIVREKVLVKGKDINRVPVLDLCVLMFRDEVFDDIASAATLATKFRETFPQRDEDFEKIFIFRSEDESSLFTTSDDFQDYETAITSVLIEGALGASAIPTPKPVAPSMDVNDPILLRVQELLVLGTSGIILTGAPGSGKSYYAQRIAKHLVIDPVADVFKVQFHPSYGYEDFVEGYRPDDDARSGYKIVDKIFLIACTRAAKLKAEDRLVVLIIDEINRGDPARVFGELLTYIERSYRGESFTLPYSGGTCAVPVNLVMIGTMNPHDRSVAQIDAAFVRRFDRIDILPSREVAEELLEKGGGLNAAQVTKIGEWFEEIQKLIPLGIGHSFFADVKSITDLQLVWRHRMKPTADLAIELDDLAIANVSNSFDALVERLVGLSGND